MAALEWETLVLDQVTVERLLSNIRFADPEDCWEWQRPPMKTGYGQLRAHGASQLAHRLSWCYFRGPIPDRKVLDHLCSNRICVNPNHLDPCSITENIGRAVGFTATHCRHGHERTDENTYYFPTGQRSCRPCRQDWARDRG